MPELDLFSSWDMSFEIDKTALSNLIKRTLSVVPISPSLPSLSNFLVSTYGSSLQLAATDLNTAVMSVAKKGVQVGDSGKALLPARRLAAIVKELDSNEKISIGVQNNVAVILSDKAKWTVSLQKLSSYPTLNFSAKLSKYSRVALLTAIEKIKFAASTNPAQPALTVINGELGKLTASDGQRLQQIVLEKELPFPLVLPASKLDLLIKALKDSQIDYLSLGQNEKYTIFATDMNVTALARVSTKFPNVEKAILKPAMENDQELIIDRRALIEAVKKVKVSSDSELGLITLAISSTIIEVRAKDRSGNEAQAQISGGIWSSTPRLVTLSHKDLLDMLYSHDSDKCSVMLGSDTKIKKLPVLVRDSGLTSVLHQSMDF